MKTTLTKAACLVLSSCLLSCQSPVKAIESVAVQTNTGSLTLSVPQNQTKTSPAARTILPSSTSIATYTATGSGPSGAALASTSSSTGSFTFNSLVVGSWTISVNGLDASNNIIAAGSTTVAITSGTTASASLQLSPAPGTGTFTSSVSWPADQSITSASATLTPAVGGSVLNLSYMVSGTSANFSSSEPAGSYLFTLNLTANGKSVVPGLIDTVLIYNGNTSTGSLTLTDANFLIPSAPTGVVATAGRGQVLLGWNTVSGALSYSVYRSTTSGFTISSLNKLTSVGTNSYGDTTATIGTTYYYLVTAVNAGGESIASSPVSAAALASYTLTTTAGTNGTVSPAGNVSATSGVPTGLTASPNNSYSFVNWTVTSGTASLGNSMSASTTVTLSSGNATVQANFGATITTVAGNGIYGYAGDGGPATAAELKNPNDVGVDSMGNFYIADEENARIRKVDILTGIISTVAGNGGFGYSGDGGLATAATFKSLDYVTVDSFGNLYLTDTLYGIRKVSASTGLISTVVASFAFPTHVVLDAAGNLVVGSEDNQSYVSEVQTPSWSVVTLAGIGSWGYNGDGMLGYATELNHPGSVAFDSLGNLYIADGGNYRIRKVSASTGIVATVAGNGSNGYAGDGGPAVSAGLSLPVDIVLDSADNLYIADNQQRVRKVAALTGVITTVAGNGIAGYAGDGGLATAADLNGPLSIALDSFGNLYISEYNSQRVRKVTGSGSGVGP